MNCVRCTASETSSQSDRKVNLASFDSLVRESELDQVATLLGHESLDTTKVYIRPSKKDLEQAVRRAAGELEEI